MKDTTVARVGWMLTGDVPLSYPSCCCPEVPSESYNLTSLWLSPAECSSAHGAWGLVYRRTEHLGRQVKSGRAAPDEPRAILLLISAGSNSDQLLHFLPDLHFEQELQRNKGGMKRWALKNTACAILSLHTKPSYLAGRWNHLRMSQ